MIKVLSVGKVTKWMKEGGLRSVVCVKQLPRAGFCEAKLSFRITASIAKRSFCLCTNKRNQPPLSNLMGELDSFLWDIILLSRFNTCAHLCLLTRNAYTPNGKGRWKEKKVEIETLLKELLVLENHWPWKDDSFNI